jgi:hypothetical protein
MENHDPLFDTAQSLPLARHAEQLKGVCGTRLLSPQEILLLCAEAIARSYTPCEKIAP